MRNWFAGSFVMLLVLALCFPAQASDRMLVFGAASMKDALEAAGRDYEQQTGGRLVFSFASSSVLAKQIAAGAPADLYVSANSQWADWLEKQAMVNAASRRNIAGNSIVIAGKPVEGNVPGPEGLLTKGKFAMGDPSHVPAGRYGREALKSLGIWEEVKKHAVYGENVRVALEYVARGEVGAAIVYGSDLTVAPELKALYRFPASSHDPIVYPALLTEKGNADAKGFLDFLSSEKGQAILAKFGFVPAGQRVGE